MRHFVRLKPEDVHRQVADGDSDDEGLDKGLGLREVAAVFVIMKREVGDVKG